MYSFEGVTQYTLPFAGRYTPSRQFSTPITVINAMMPNPKTNDKHRRMLRKQAQEEGDDFCAWLNKPSKKVLHRDVTSAVVVVRQANGSPLMREQLATLSPDLCEVFFVPSPIDVLASGATMRVYLVRKPALKILTKLLLTSPERAQEALER